MLQDPRRRMDARGINQDTAGNLSVRTGDGFLIAPTSLPHGRMTPEDLVEMAFDGTYRGRHRPLSEWRFHRDILRHRPDAEVVLHRHSLHASVLACRGREMPAFHGMVGVAGGTAIRRAKYATSDTQGALGPRAGGVAGPAGLPARPPRANLVRPDVGCGARGGGGNAGAHVRAGAGTRRAAGVGGGRDAPVHRADAPREPRPGPGPGRGERHRPLGGSSGGPGRRG